MPVDTSAATDRIVDRVRAVHAHVEPEVGAPVRGDRQVDGHRLDLLHEGRTVKVGEPLPEIDGVMLPRQHRHLSEDRGPESLQAGA